MEFTKLSEVAIVETATDDDKVLIEQNGEIKRVPKTEVGGGGGGNILVITGDEENGFTANMTLAEAIASFTSKELRGVVMYLLMESMSVGSNLTMYSDVTQMVGFECFSINCMMPEITLYWTAAGISTVPPM